MMDRTDLNIALNEQDEYQPREQKRAALVQMLHNSGQIGMIRESLADGDTLERMADELGYQWDVAADLLAEAIRVALKDA